MQRSTRPSSEPRRVLQGRLHQSLRDPRASLEQAPAGGIRGTAGGTSRRERRRGDPSGGKKDAEPVRIDLLRGAGDGRRVVHWRARARSEEHTSELQSQSNLVCRLLLEKKKTKHKESM